LFNLFIVQTFKNRQKDYEVVFLQKKLK